MAKACERGRCPARADVADWTTTEYRKGCRLAPCRNARTLSAQRAKTAKAASAAAAAAEQRPVLVALPTPRTSDDVAPVRSPPAERDGWDAFDVVAAVRADLAAIDTTHPMARSLSAMALALAHQLQMTAGSVTSSAPGIARQLAAVLAQLTPEQSDDDALETFLADLLSDDDSDRDPDRAAAG